jgi:GDP-L-fucose synthase
MEKNSKIHVAGHRGLAGSAIVRCLEKQGYSNILKKTSKELDLRNQQATLDFYAQEKPNYVFLAAAKVGGIYANNTYKADFLFENLAIAQNVIHAAHASKVKKLLFLGSSCIYPKLAAQPLQEESLLTGPLEPTNEPYAIAKIAGIKLCETYKEQYGDNFISAMPTNLYGLNDNYHPTDSHVLPALIRRFHEAKISGAQEVVIWGDGSPLREFLYSDDLAEALVLMMQSYNDAQFLNVGYGSDISIKDLANTIAGVIGYTGSLVFDTSKPNGTPKKLMDSSKIHSLGWQANIDLKTGIKLAYLDFLKTHNTI